MAIFGAGPVGLLAAHSAALRGASQIFVVDKEPDRLALAERFGATAINFAEADPAEVIMEGTDGFGVDCGVKAVGYQAHDPTGQEHPEMVLDKLVEVVRATGRLGIVGVYHPQDPGARPCDALTHRVSRVAAGTGPEDLRPVRQAGRGLDQSPAPPRSLSITRRVVVKNPVTFVAPAHGVVQTYTIFRGISVITTKPS